MSLHFANVVLEYAVSKDLLRALDGVTLKLGGVEFIAIVGPSGCGKSSLLNLAAGFLKPTEGSIEHGNSRVVGPSHKRAMVFQEDAVFPWFTVRENVAYGLVSIGQTKSRIKEVTEKYLDLVGLSAFAEYFPKALSGGMKKRVDLARAYAANAEVLLMDEPFGALDARTRELMQLELQHLQKSEPRTILFVTHDIAEALFVADRVVVMTPRPGRIQMIVDVPFSRPRTLELKKDPEFLALQTTIEKALGN
jgi:NitT/TauT family transport system ATP-binding protein